MAVLDLSEMPNEPAAKLMWLSGLKQAALTEIEDAFADTYAQLRSESRLEWAIAQGLHSERQVLALTRRWNRQNARMVQWGDGIDRTSSAYGRSR